MLQIKVFETDIPRNIEVASRSLWKDTFGDSDAYIDIVFGALARNGILAVAEDDGGVVAHLVALPYHGLGKNGEIVECLYLCGLATLSHYRRRGIMGELIHKINRLASQQGYGRSFLIPANDKLRSYYSKFGFVTDSHRKIFRIDRHSFGLWRQSVGCGANRNPLNKDNGRIFGLHQLTSTIRQKAYKELYTAFAAVERRESPLRILHDGRAFCDCVEENRIGGGEVLFSPASGDFMFLEHKDNGDLFSPCSSFFKSSGSVPVSLLSGFIEAAFHCFGDACSVSFAYDCSETVEKATLSVADSFLGKVSSSSVVPYGMSCILNCEEDDCPSVEQRHLGISLMLD